MASIARVCGRALITLDSAVHEKVLRRNTTFHPPEITGALDQGVYSKEELRAEHAIWFSNVDDSWKKAGKITKEILERMLENPDVRSANKYSRYKNPNVRLVVDSWLDHLEKGRYPQTPTWVNGSKKFTPTNRSDWIKNPATQAFFARVSNVEGGVSLDLHPEKALRLDLSEVKDEDVHRLISSMQNTFSIGSVQDGSVASFKSAAFKGGAAHAPGWIHTVRLAIYSDDYVYI